MTKTRKDYVAEVSRVGSLFANQPAYVPYFWEVFMNGVHDSEQDDGTICCRVDADDKTLFPELRRRKWVRIRQGDQGFIEEV